MSLPSRGQYVGLLVLIVGEVADLECASLERGLEVVRLTSEDDFVNVEVVRSTHDLAVRELFGVAESKNGVSNGQEEIMRPDSYLARPAL